MKLVQLLKLAEEFETAVDSWQPDPDYDQSAYDARILANDNFAGKKRREVLSTVSSMVPSNMTFVVSIVDKGPDSEGSVYCDIAVELTSNSKSDAEQIARKTYKSMLAGDETTEVTDLSFDKENNLLVVVLGFKN